MVTTLTWKKEKKTVNKSELRKIQGRLDYPSLRRTVIITLQSHKDCTLTRPVILHSRMVSGILYKQIEATNATVTPTESNEHSFRCLTEMKEAQSTHKSQRTHPL